MIYQSITIWNFFFCRLISKIINVLSSVLTEFSRNGKTSNKIAVGSKVTHRLLVILNTIKDWTHLRNIKEVVCRKTLSLLM